MLGGLRYEQVSEYKFSLSLLKFYAIEMTNVYSHVLPWVVTERILYLSYGLDILTIEI